ncbi:uncharacterized protein N0V96_004828 [Colletotrichum fioriniae]|uniref:uncharacterized protein n=1 Tax=Colletotrichum fioriniae TaxID=710243 RepID=UPI0032DAA99F|nr:hypothetical protein N0V96_004828 [Colletotrichum fioriniae]
MILVSSMNGKNLEAFEALKSNDIVFEMVEVGQSLRYHPNSGGHHVFDLNLALIIALCVTLSALEMDTTNYGTGAQIEDVPRPTLLQFFKVS